MIVKNIQPSNGRTEKIVVLTSVFALILLWLFGIHLRFHKTSTKTVEEWQIDAFRRLNPTEQGIYFDLHSATADIAMLYEEYSGNWPKISILEEDGLHPFVKDHAWKQRAKLNWNMRAFSTEQLDTAVYIGASSDAKGCSSFLLKINKYKTLRLMDLLLPFGLIDLTP